MDGDSKVGKTEGVREVFGYPQSIYSIRIIREGFLNYM